MKPYCFMDFHHFQKTQCTRQLSPSLPKIYMNYFGGRDACVKWFLLVAMLAGVPNPKVCKSSGI